MNKSGNITIMLAEDHPFVREGIACLLGGKPEFDVVGECSDGVAAVELIVSLRPKIAIVDLQMPRLHSIEVIRKVNGSRERTVFGLLVDGMRSKDIGLLMDISPKPVDSYRSNILRKLGRAGIAGLVKFAIERAPPNGEREILGVSQISPFKINDKLI